MATTKQRAAARRNIKQAAKAAKRKKTIARLPAKTRTALGKQGAKVAGRKRKARRDAAR
jgi:ABC-type transport system involved in Fe-S cluster assembly fused permease/ATPase subunit